ncbi:MAG TPA: hypothetical protein VMI35_05310 [Puia sp.]|nr:hypothetical protein [Puia sp.]
MKEQTRGKYSGFPLLAILLFCCCVCHGQSLKTAPIANDSFNVKNRSFLLPLAHPAWKYYHSLSVFYVVTPSDWTLDNIIAPMLSYAGKYSLPYGFNVQGSFTTLIISNRINLGPFWNYSTGNYHFAAGYQVAFNFGELTQFGYNTWVKGWEQQPSLTAGYSFQKLAVVLRGDLYWTNAFYVSQDKYVIPYTTSFINGYSISGSIEQKLYTNKKKNKDKLLSFGVKVYNVRYHFVAWPAFPVNKYRYWVPEFQLGLNL